jgi:scyllo-inositol 2-dehydrogenase (NADP+)
VQIYLRDGPNELLNLNKGWNTRYTTELTEEVWFYLRGEEYSAQIDHFIQSIKDGCSDTRSTFRSALDADLVAAMMIKDAESSHVNADFLKGTASTPTKKVGLWEFIKNLLR